MLGSPDERHQIVAYDFDPWAGARAASYCFASNQITEIISGLENDIPDNAPLAGFEISLQERSFGGKPDNSGCLLLMNDFGIFYRPRETVRLLRDRPPSELAAYYLFRECRDLSVEDLCKANAMLGGPGSLRIHEHGSSRYISGQRSVYMPADRVRSELEYLVTQINAKPNLDFFRVASATLLHCLIIHPFSDANGRLAFLLFQYCLFRSGIIKNPIVPVGPFIEKHRSEYLYALISVSLKKNILPLFDLLSQALINTKMAVHEAIEHLQSGGHQSRGRNAN